MPTHLQAVQLTVYVSLLRPFGAVLPPNCPLPVSAPANVFTRSETTPALMIINPNTLLNTILKTAFHRLHPVFVVVDKRAVKWRVSGNEGSILFGEIGLALNSARITAGRCCCLVGGLGRCLRRVRDFGWGLLLVSSFCRICFGFRVRLHRRYYRCRRDGNVRIFRRLVRINAGRRFVHRVCPGR